MHRDNSCTPEAVAALIRSRAESEARVRASRRRERRLARLRCFWCETAEYVWLRQKPVCRICLEAMR